MSLKVGDRVQYKDAEMVIVCIAPDYVEFDEVSGLADAEAMVSKLAGTRYTVGWSFS